MAAIETSDDCRYGWRAGKATVTKPASAISMETAWQLMHSLATDVYLLSIDVSLDYK